MTKINENINEIDEIIRYWKIKIITEEDNLNQDKFTKKEIDADIYNYNKTIMRSTWDNIEKLTLADIKKILGKLIGLGE
jgi:hypothetical protein